MRDLSGKMRGALVGLALVASMLFGLPTQARADGATGASGSQSPLHTTPAERLGVAHAVAGHATVDLTSNWAGIVDQGSTFTVVQAQWSVPAVSAASTTESSTTWVGIDGFDGSGAGASDLIQCGTAQQANPNGTASYYEWYQIGSATAAFIINQVSPDDAMKATVEQIQSGTWQIVITDISRSYTYTKSFSWNPVADSAEWIEEAPTNPSTGQIETLANFGTVTFSNTQILAANPSAVTATPVVMDQNGTVLASPGGYSSSGFAVVYESGGPAVTSVSPNSGSAIGGTPVTISGSGFNGSNTVDFGSTPAEGFTVLSSSRIAAVSPPGSGVVNVSVSGPQGTSTISGADVFSYAGAPPPPGGGQHGYWLVGSDGGIFTFGSAPFYGSTGALALQRPVVGITPTAERSGYWLVASDGGIFAFGDAGYYGSVPGLGIAPAGTPDVPRELAAPIVAMVPSSDGGGYFMVASDGGVFSFGDARFAGSCPGIGGCNGTAVAVMPDATGNGYWLVTTNGLVYTFGDAPYLGSSGSEGVPVTAAVRTPDGRGYYLVFANGAIAPFGDANYFGSALGLLGGLNPANAVFTTSDGGGYWEASANGTVFSFGDAPNDGGMNGQALNAPIIAATGW